jgi:hypothetical protein
MCVYCNLELYFIQMSLYLQQINIEAKDWSKIGSKTLLNPQYTGLFTAILKMKAVSLPVGPQLSGALFTGSLSEIIPFILLTLSQLKLCQKNVHTSTYMPRADCVRFRRVLQTCVCATMLLGVRLHKSITWLGKFCSKETVAQKF